MSRARFHRIASRLHKWLALIIGIQLFFWFASGAFMSLVPIERVRGEHLVDRGAALALPAAIDAAAALSHLPQGTTSAELAMADGRVAVIARKGKTDLARLDAASGAVLPRFDKSAAERIARAAWLGKAHPPAHAVLLASEPGDYRGELPVWQVNFADPDRTRVYLAPVSGRILAVRTSTWRVYDFLWGLHIMDWKGRENINSPWLSAFAIGAFILALAGAVLLFFRWPLRAGTRQLNA